MRTFFFLLLLALQPNVGFILLSESVPFCSFFTLLSPPSYSLYFHIFFNVYITSLPWSSSDSRIRRFPLYYSVDIHPQMSYVITEQYQVSALSARPKVNTFTLLDLLWTLCYHMTQII